MIYLDAALDRTNPADEKILQQAPTPPRGPEDSRSLETVSAWQERYQGYSPPEAELRAIFRVGGDGSILGRRLTPETRRMLDAAEERPRNSEVKAPVLAIYALHDSLADAFPWILGDSAAMSRALQFPVRSYLEARRQEIEQFEVTRGRVVIVDGPHNLVLARPEEVEKTMRGLLSGVRSR